MLLLHVVILFFIYIHRSQSSVLRWAGNLSLQLYIKYCIDPKLSQIRESTLQIRKRCFSPKLGLFNKGLIRLERWFKLIPSKSRMPHLKALQYSQGSFGPRCSFSPAQTGLIYANQKWFRLYLLSGRERHIAWQPGQVFLQTEQPGLGHFVGAMTCPVWNYGYI